ncbi:MAG: helix-turn-helix domain-containing protein [Phycisphaerales bacterium]|nr:helix-turn-helix domain-containing protein [Phycisphaerales bacterium]
MKPTQDIGEQLREAIRGDGRPLFTLAPEIGMDRSVLSRFVNGRRGITIETAAAIARYFRLELRPVKGGK